MLADRGSESPWLWLVIVVGGVGLHFVTRALGWEQARSWADVSDSLLGAGPAWQLRAIYLAIIGGGSLYHVATGSRQWYWWLLPLVAWAAFAEVVIKRSR